MHAQPQQAAGQAAEKAKPGFVRKREEFQAADAGAAGPTGSKRAFLKNREQDLRLDEKLNKIQVRVGWLVIRVDVNGGMSAGV